MKIAAKTNIEKTSEFNAAFEKPYDPTTFPGNMFTRTEMNMLEEHIGTDFAVSMDRIGFTLVSKLACIISESNENFATQFKCSDLALESIRLRFPDSKVLVVELGGALIVVHLTEAWAMDLEEVRLKRVGNLLTASDEGYPSNEWAREI